MHTMTAKVEVGVALGYLPREDTTIGVLVSVPVHGFDFFRADAEAREVACAIVACNPRVVMPVRATILEVTL